jgi:hypothetical protein
MPGGLNQVNSGNMNVGLRGGRRKQPVGARSVLPQPPFDPRPGARHGLLLLLIVGHTRDTPGLMPLSGNLTNLSHCTKRRS